jgi:FPC/CPF motif-containing protein YcgG
MSSPAREYDPHAPFFTSGDRIAVPPNAVELLRESINARRDGSALTEKIRSAAALICDEAHRAEAMPEELVVSIKELCHSLPEYETIRGARERDAFLSVVVTYAIEEYYRV